VWSWHLTPLWVGGSHLPPRTSSAQRVWILLSILSARLSVNRLQMGEAEWLLADRYPGSGLVHNPSAISDRLQGAVYERIATGK
jgi:hypothetical protein